MVECASRFNVLPSRCVFPNGFNEQYEKTAKGPVAVGGFADVYRVELLSGQILAVKKPRKAVLQKMKFVSFIVFASSGLCLKSLPF